MMTSDRTKLKTGHRPVQVMTRTLQRSEVLFEEGSRGREVYIVQSGLLSILRRSESGDRELAELGPNSIVGEMSLLDHQPRSATVIAKTPCKLLIINELIFHNTLSKAPAWLSSIIKIVASRLRDANKRLDQTLLINREPGLISIIALLLPQFAYTISAQRCLDNALVLREAAQVCGIEKTEAGKLLHNLQERKLIQVVTDKNFRRHICILRPEEFKL